jgi:hypothetical protein
MTAGGSNCSFGVGLDLVTYRQSVVSGFLSRFSSSERFCRYSTFLVGATVRGLNNCRIGGIAVVPLLVLVLLTTTTTTSTSTSTSTGATAPGGIS